MFTLTRLFRTKFISRTHARPNTQSKRCRPLAELLENRLAPAVNGVLNGSTLTVNLGAPGDQAFLRVNGTNIEVDDNTGFTSPQTFSAATVTNIQVMDTGA